MTDDEKPRKKCKVCGRVYRVYHRLDPASTEGAKGDYNGHRVVYPGRRSGRYPSFVHEAEDGSPVQFVRLPETCYGAFPPRPS